MIKKIGLFSGIICFSIAASATELSQSTLAICKNYLENPTAQMTEKENVALEECFQNSVCQNQLADLKSCANNMTTWELNRPPEKSVAVPTSTAKNPAPATSDTTTLPQTQDDQQNTLTSTTTEAPSNPPAENANENNQPKQPLQEKNQKKQHINWF